MHTYIHTYIPPPQGHHTPPTHGGGRGGRGGGNTGHGTIYIYLYIHTHIYIYYIQSYAVLVSCLSLICYICMQLCTIHCFFHWPWALALGLINLCQDEALHRWALEMARVKNGLDGLRRNNVVKTKINHPFGNGLYHLFIVIWGWFILVLPTLIPSPMYTKHRLNGPTYV